MENILICTVGLPRSGKSTWSKIQGLPIVNPDGIRLAAYGKRFWSPGELTVWRDVWVFIRSLFLAGHNKVILDSTNITRKLRDDCSFKGFPDDSLLPEWKAYFHYIPTDQSECIKRAGLDTEIIPVIEHMASLFEPLEKDEAIFDHENL